MLRIVAYLLLAAAVAAVPARADEALPAVAKVVPRDAIEGGRVTEVIDGDTVVLDGAREVRLVGIQAPKLPLGRPGFPAWPLAPDAKAAVERLALGKTVRLEYGGTRIDRHGRLLAHLTSDGVWVQGELLRLGLGRVYTFRDNRARAAEMLTLERAARDQRRGIWALPYYRVLDATETPKFIDTFQIVEGRVANAAVVKRRGYLNFGPDWKSDFTIMVAPGDVPTLAAAGLKVADLEGRRLRVRGWLKSVNGPMIEATHPEQIEVLDE